MAQLPDRVAEAMYEAASRWRKDSGVRSYLGMSGIGGTCRRKIWYGFRGYTPTALEGADLDDAADLVGEDMPSPGEYLSARQKDGKPLGADEIYKETWLWLKNRGCEKLVNKRLLESYSLAFARFIQCEDALSTYGLLGKHPTTGGVVASPFASLSQSYQKQANLLWYEIFDIVKQNCTTKFDGSPQDDLMEQLLRSRK